MPLAEEWTMKTPTPRAQLEKRTAFAGDVAAFTPGAMMREYMPYHCMRRPRGEDDVPCVDAWVAWMESGHDPYRPDTREDARHTPISADVSTLAGRPVTMKESRALLRAVVGGTIDRIVEGVEADDLGPVVERHTAAYASASALITPGGGYKAALGRSIVAMSEDADLDCWSLFRPHPILTMDDPDDILFAWCLCIVRPAEHPLDDPMEVVAFASGTAIDTSKDPQGLARFLTNQELDVTIIMEELQDKGWPALELATGEKEDAFRADAQRAFALMVDRLWIRPENRGQGVLAPLLHEMRGIMLCGYDRVDLSGKKVHTTSEDAASEASEVAAEARMFGFRLPCVSLTADDPEPWDPEENERLKTWVPSLRDHLTAEARKAGVPVVYWPDTGE